MKNEFFFGYGSLVNGATHDYGAMQPATLTGWSRIWHFTRSRDLAYLSITPDPQGSITGTILAAPIQDSALQSREAAYIRHTVTDQISAGSGQTAKVHTFAIPVDTHRPRSENSALLLSYIDVVVQGYYRAFGAASAHNFFTTTHGWGAKIINDRAAPRYPRHQSLTSHERALVDEGLSALGAEVIQA